MPKELQSKGVSVSSLLGGDSKKYWQKNREVTLGGEGILSWVCQGAGSHSGHESVWVLG